MAVNPIGTSDGQYFESPFHMELADYRTTQTASRYGGAVVDAPPTGQLPTLGDGLDPEAMGRQEQDMDTTNPYEESPSIPYGGLSQRNKMNMQRRLDNPEPLGPPEMRPVDVEHLEDIPGRRITDATPDSIKPGQQYAMEAKRELIPIGPRGHEAGGGSAGSKPSIADVGTEAFRKNMMAEGRLRTDKAFADVDKALEGAKSLKEIKQITANPKVKIDSWKEEKGDGRFSSFGGQRVFTFKDGDKTGTVEATLKPDGKTIQVEWIAAGPPAHKGGYVNPEGFGKPWSMGPDKIFKIFRQLAEEYPGATAISGYRVSGARGRAATAGDVTREFPIEYFK